MSSRPEILFPLFADLKSLKGVGPRTAESFARMDIIRPKDLLFTLPSGGIDRRQREDISGLPTGTVVTVPVHILRHDKPSQKGRPYRILAELDTTTITLVWFHAQESFLEKLAPVGSEQIVSGKLELFDGHAQIVHPDHVVAVGEMDQIPAFEPIYPLTSGITQRQISKAAKAALALAPTLEEWIDDPLIRREGWPSWRDALNQSHEPNGEAALSPNFPSRKRLAYDEFFAHQLTLALAREWQNQRGGRSAQGTGVLRKKVLDNLDFPLTGAQKRAVDEILADLASENRMYRLLQGDVGSGKTLVAFLALLNIAEAGGQGVMMAPTEILARQHAESLQELATIAGLRLEVLTGRDKGLNRKSKLKDLADGKIDVLVGTHAVFQPDVHFADLRLAIVDEQHRFGVRQRLELGQKGDRVDVLVMTATPIPRSLALSQYGDMDVSILDEKPPGRKPVQTALVSAEKLQNVIAHLQKAVAEGRQAYWVCPLVDESETVDLVAAEERFRMLRAILGDDVVGLVHGQMPSEQKDRAMADFVSGKTKVLVATTVIEVGVNVPNASIMVIEQAENFGLAQLHQLRGRVGRGAAQSTCLLLYHPPLNETATRRLQLLRETEDGFRIAEEDLMIRGAGDMIGTAQSGIPRFRIGNLELQAGLMRTAQTDARALLAIDPDLTSKRGRAARVLLWLLEQDKALRLIQVG